MVRLNIARYIAEQVDDKFSEQIDEKIDKNTAEMLLLQDMIHQHAIGLQNVYAELKKLEVRFNKIMKGRG